jgi:hypothetical protein
VSNSTYAFKSHVQFDIKIPDTNKSNTDEKKSPSLLQIFGEKKKKKKKKNKKLTGKI